MKDERKEALIRNILMPPSRHRQRKEKGRRPGTGTPGRAVCRRETKDGKQ
ncbi:MAG: hypothetical protein ACLR0F_24740 [Eisenbergiella sp.]